MVTSSRTPSLLCLCALCWDSGQNPVPHLDKVGTTGAANSDTVMFLQVLYRVELELFSLICLGPQVDFGWQLPTQEGGGPASELQHQTNLSHSDIQYFHQPQRIITQKLLQRLSGHSMGNDDTMAILTSIYGGWPSTSCSPRRRAPRD